MRILIVEDDETLADGLVAGLQLSGFVPELTGTCADADCALRAGGFAAVVLDLMLPDGSGLDLLKRWRLDGLHIPVILLTALDSVADRIAGLDRGADDYLGKPFDLDELAARLRAIARRQEGRAEPVMRCGALALAIWLSVGRGLQPLNTFAKALAGRDDDNLAPVASGPLPSEIQPMGTALNGLLARLAQARTRERDFIVYAAHELKTPLAGIRTQAQVARAAPDDPTKQHALDQLVGAVDRTARLVAQLLDLARVEDEKSPFGPMKPVENIIEKVVTGLQDLACSRGVAVRIERKAGGIAADPVHLGLALRNVIENAVQAAPAGSVVTVVLSASGIEVCDQGPGIDPRDLPRVTERFFNGTASKGSGLGLAIAEAAVARIGWAMKFHAAHPSGQCVHFTVPRRTGLQERSAGSA